MYRLLDELAVSPWWNADIARCMGEVSPVYCMRSICGMLEDIMLGVSNPEVAQCRELGHSPILFPSILCFSLDRPANEDSTSSIRPCNSPSTR